MHFLRKNHLAIAVLCSSILFPSIGDAMGDPLVNLRMFFVHSFRVQFDEPSEIMLNYDPKFANAAPEDISEKRALHPFKSGTESRFKLSCEDIEILGYEDWREGFENARQARAASTGNLVTSDMRWPNFAGWNAPAYATINVESSILGNLISADVSIAVLGNDFDTDSVLDQTDRRLSDPTLGRVLSITGMGYHILYQSQLSEKSIQLSSTTSCDGFTMYNLEVR